MGHDAIGIVVIGMAAFVLPLFAQRIRLPAFVLEMLFGILVGPQVLDFLGESEIIDTMAELGFLLLMFLSGFEIDFGKLERQGPGQLLTGFAVFLATLGFAAAYAIGFGHGAFMTFILATTSVGLVVPTLRATQRSSTRLGQVILISALMADFLTLVGVTVYAIIYESGFGWNLLSFPALILSILLLLLGLKRLAWWYPERFDRLFAAHDPEELGIRASLALMFVCVGLSYLLGVEAILGAFLAGSVFALVFRHRGQLEQKLTGFSFGFFVPIFFIHVGTRFDVQAVLAPQVLGEAFGIIGAALAIKLLAALVLFFRGFSPRQVLAAGVLLSARLSLIIAVAEVGVRLELIGPIIESQAILLALVTSALSPALFRAVMPRARGAT
jgi:Kef-type K+ transport system membrane component KefB